MPCGNSILEKFLRKTFAKSEKTLLQEKNLVAFHFSDGKKFKEAVTVLRKKKIRFDTESLALLSRLIVPSKAVRHVKGYSARFVVISIVHLPEFLGKNPAKNNKAGWHGCLDSPTIKAVLHYKYHLIDYVRKHVAHYQEAFRMLLASAQRT